MAIFLAIFSRKSNSAQSNCNSINQESNSENKTKKEIIEDSEGDGLMLFNDPMFPPEFEDEADEF